jgi:hypothetical protein
VNLGPGERLAILGPPGYGKTTFVQYVLSTAAGGPLRSVVVFDSKQDPREWRVWGARHGYAVTLDPTDILRHRLVVLEVNQLWLEDRAGWSRPGRPGYQWTQALRHTLHRGNTVAVFDECLQTLPASFPHPEARRILTQGRSRGVPAILCSQLGNTMDTYILRLAEWCVSFSAIPDTVERLQRSRGIDSSLLLGLRKFDYAVHRAGWPVWEARQRVPLAMEHARPASAASRTPAPAPQSLTRRRPAGYKAARRPSRPIR